MSWLDNDRHAAWGALTWACALAVAAPLLLHDFPPSSDFPEHAATVATLVDLQRAGPLSRWYQADFTHTQYWLGTLVASWLSPVVGGPVVALRLLLAIALAGQLVALRWLLGVLGGDRRWALVAGVMSWSRPLVLGFVPFVLGQPLVLLAFGVVAHPQAARWPRQVAMGLLSLACFYLNLSNVAWLVVGAVALAWAVHGPRRGLRALVGLGVLIGPGALWLAHSDVMHPDASAFRGVDFAPRFHPPWRVLREAPEWLTDVWPGREGAVVLACWAGLMLATVVLSVATKPTTPEGPTPRAARALVFVTAALWFAFPFERGWLWGLNQRFAPSLMMVMPAVFVFRAGWSRRAVFFAGLGLTLVSAGLAEVHARRQDEQVKQVASLLQGLTGSRLLQLTFEHDSSVMRDSAFLHLSGYHRVWNAGGNEPSFVDTPQSVLRYRPERKPWLRPWPWEFEPEKFDNTAEGPQYDYVLVLGETSSFPPPSGAAPRWALHGQAGRWRLYAQQPAAVP